MWWHVGTMYSTVTNIGVINAINYRTFHHVGSGRIAQLPLSCISVHAADTFQILELTSVDPSWYYKTAALWLGWFLLWTLSSINSVLSPGSAQSRRLFSVRLLNFVRCNRYFYLSSPPLKVNFFSPVLALIPKIVHIKKKSKKYDCDRIIYGVGVGEDSYQMIRDTRIGIICMLKYLLYSQTQSGHVSIIIGNSYVEKKKNERWGRAARSLRKRVTNP